MHGPVDDHQWDDVMDASLLRPVEEESELSPPQKRKQPSWVRKMGPQEPQALLPNKQRIPGL